MRPLLALHGRRLVPGLMRGYWQRCSARSMAAWIAPEPGFRREVAQRLDERVDARCREPEAEGPYGFYERNTLADFIHPLSSMDREEDHEAGRRLGIRVRHPYWDAELVDFLNRMPPQFLLYGGRQKGLVRPAVARRFPGLGFERHTKVSATTFFKATMQREGPAVCRDMGGASALARLGIVDARAVDATLAAGFSSKESRPAQRIWDIMSIEAWVRSHN
jgi:hypothetical protein